MITIDRNYSPNSYFRILSHRWLNRVSARPGKPECLIMFLVILFLFNFVILNMGNLESLGFLNLENHWKLRKNREFHFECQNLVKITEVLLWLFCQQSYQNFKIFLMSPTQSRKKFHTLLLLFPFLLSWTGLPLYYRNLLG